MDLYIGFLYKGGHFGLKELRGGNYHRIEMTCMDWFVSEDKTEIINAIDIRWPRATEDWEKIYAFGVWDSLKDGNLLVTAELERETEVRENDIANFIPGFLTVSLSALGVES